MTTRRRIYWDACVFIKHIDPDAEPTEEAVLQGIDEVFEGALRGNLIIVTSTITRAEVLNCKVRDTKKHLFPALLRRYDILEEIDVTPRVSSAAHDIRDYYKRVKGSRVGLGDCIHIATACLFHAEEMHTLDGDGGGSPLKLSGRIANQWDLKICKPYPTVGRLFTFKRSPDEESHPSPVEIHDDSDEVPNDES